MGEWDINWAAIAPLLALVAAFIAYCLVTLVRNDVRHLPKWAWAIIICGTIPFGGVAYLMLGRDPGDAS